MKTGFLIAGAVIFASACVPKAQHDDIMARELKCSAELESLNKDRENVKRELQELTRKVSDSEARNEELSQMNQMLAEKNSEYSKRSVDAQKEILKLKEGRGSTPDRTPGNTDLENDLSKALETEIKRGDASIAPRGDEITVTVPDRLLFLPSSDRLAAGAGPLLKKLLAVYKRGPLSKLTVETHTDNLPLSSQLRKRFPTHWEYSAARSSKLVIFFEENGLDPSRMVAAGIGEHRPIAPNKNDDGRRKNRRVEFIARLSSSP